MTQSETQPEVEYYARGIDIDHLPELFRSTVAGWLDPDDMILDSGVGNEYIRLCAEDEEQLEARIDLLKNPPIGTTEVKIKET